MTTIPYDRPVADYVDRLTATGHVTHTTAKKTSVTLHHNGGVNVSFDEILSTWTTRPASAHFDVNSAGDVAQFVKVDEYAWAVGNTEGNIYSISIEMTDESGSPNWVVGDATWKSAARLGAWLFYHEIGTRPSSSNVFPHQHWSSTDCPGPFVMSHFSEILAEMQAQYDQFAGHPSPAPSPTPASDSLVVDGVLGPKTITRWQEVMHTPVDGVISNPSVLVKAVQTELNRKIGAGLAVDGVGLNQDGKYYHTVSALQAYMGTPHDGIMSVPVSEVVKAVQFRLNTGSF